MKGLDTNFLLRLLLDDDAGQAAAARALVRAAGGQPGAFRIDAIVLCELVWVLEAGYGFDRQTTASVVHAVLTSVELAVENRDQAIAALEQYRRGYDFSDAYIGMRNRAAGCETTLTFDKRASRMADFTLVRSEAV